MKTKIRTAGVFIMGVILTGCTYYENVPIKPPKPKVSRPTATLEASFVATPPNKVTSLYWKTADYLPIVPSNIVTSQVPVEDGLFNVSGTFNGLSSFNNGKDPKISIKAAYDNANLYLLVSWKDTTFNMSNAAWVFNGSADPNKAGSTLGWTSQRSDDKLTLSFDMGSQRRDIWKWSLALSEPLGFAEDLLLDGANGLAVDAGNKSYVRNEMVAGNNRSGPMYEWDGVQQELTRNPGGFSILDPGFYLLNKKNYAGDALAGETVFQGACADCHGPLADGNGTVYPTSVALNAPGKFNRFVLQSFSDLVSAPTHEGSAHFTPLTAKEREDLFARLRGFSGVPGYYLQNPTGSNSDVLALSNVPLAKIDPNKGNGGYSVLLVRALNTGHGDDLVFAPASKPQYSFHIYLSDNDHLNQIGSLNATLTFKTKAP